MPTYDYTCQQCGNKHEAFQKIGDDPLKECPQCHHLSLERGIGGGFATFCFKGNGFYINDSKESSQVGKCGCSGKHTCN